MAASVRCAHAGISATCTFEFFTKSIAVRRSLQRGAVLLYHMDAPAMRLTGVSCPLQRKQGHEAVSCGAAAARRRSSGAPHPGGCVPQAQAWPQGREMMLKTVTANWRQWQYQMVARSDCRACVQSARWLDKCVQKL
jgi:hypothetical protein